MALRSGTSNPHSMASSSISRQLSSRRIAPSDSRSSSQGGFSLRLRSRWFVASWLVVAVFRACESIFLIAMTYLYFWLLHDSYLTANTIGQFTFYISYGTLKSLVCGFAIMGGLEAMMLLRSVVLSLKSRQLTFTSSAGGGSTISSGGAGSSASRSVMDRHSSWLMQSSTQLKRRWIDPVFFIRGTYFDHFFLLQEYLEMASQIYQAYQMSVYISTRWINHLFVFMIFLNGCSTPIIHWLVPSTNVPLRRLISVTCSAFLNFVNSTVIPFIIFMPYVYALDGNVFPDQYLMNDVWYAQGVRENSQLFVTSVVDFWATLIPHWSMFSCLATCEGLLRRSHGQNRTVVVVVVPCSSNSPSKDPANKPKHAAETPQKSKIVAKVEMLRYHMLWIAGIVTLCIHIASQSPPVLTGCKLASTPWFATKSSCIIMNVNCYRREIDGNQQQLHQILTQLNPRAVFQVVFSHCPKLEIPPIIRTFHHLGGLDIWNCTLVEWAREASVHQAFHAELNYVFVIGTKLSGIPDGLLDANFPSGIEIMNFYDTNLTKLPANVSEIWTSIAGLNFEFSKFERFPEPLTKMQLMYFEFTGNPMTAMDSGLYLNGLSDFFQLSNSSLSSLPNTTMGDLSRLYDLELEYNRLTEVPLYLREWYLDKVRKHEMVGHSLFGNPYCSQNVSNADVEEKEYQLQVCAQDHGSAAGLFPIDQMAEQRLL